MRQVAVVLILLLSAPTLADDDDRPNEIWIDGSTFYKAIKHKKKSTIYFKEWSAYIKPLLADDNYYIALHLDEAFDPLPTDGLSLPNLQTLSTISNTQLLESYLHFFVDFNRTKGISHLVLPDTLEMNAYEKEVIRYANRLAPYFFLYPTLLSYDLPEDKEAFIEASASRRVYLAKQDVDTRKLEKWNQKFVKKSSDPFLRSLRSFKNSSFQKVDRLPQPLAEELFAATITAIDAEGLFPITSKYLTYMGEDALLKKELSKYYILLDERTAHVPTVVDIRSGRHEVFEGDILLSPNFLDIENSALVIPMRITKDYQSLCKIIIGAQGTEGRSLRNGSRRLQDLGIPVYADKALSRQASEKIDSLLAYAISHHATPGAQISVIKGREIIFEKSYGYYTYDSIKAVSKHTIYDIASLTKVTATLPAIGLLIDQGKVSLDAPISTYLPRFKNSNKSGITIKQLLSHNGGLKPYVPFWKMTLSGDRLDVFYYKNKQDEENDKRSYGYEPNPALLDTIKGYLIASDLIRDPSKYSYSDLGFIVLHLIVEQVSGQSFDAFLYDNFYAPMGLHDTFFNPLKKGVARQDITPTEYDIRYRNYQVWGEVHDRNALVFGGASGHAGLFSNATDIAKLMYMYLSDGTYGGYQYLYPQTLRAFNTRYFKDNRRGLGWDKKDSKKERSATALASDDSFGHTGFTGTMAWADPQHELIFVFLSNRVYPDANNKKLSTYDTRKQVHRVLYESLTAETETYLPKD